MDYRDYPALMERYNELGPVSVGPEETRESLIKKLMDTSYEKKQISGQTNAIIRDYIAVYEKDPSLLNEEVVAGLRDFLERLMPVKGTGDYVDPSVSQRIAQLLLEYDQAAQDPDQIVRMMGTCMRFDLMLMDHRDASGSSEYSLMAEQYLKDFDKLSDQNKRLLVSCWLLCVYNKKDLTFGLRKYREIKRRIQELRQTMGEDFAQEGYIQCKTYVLGFAMSAWYKTFAPNSGAPSAAVLEDLEKNADVIEELADDLRAVVKSDQALTLLSDRLTTWYYIAQADFYLGKITMEEMLARTEELTHPHEDYGALEQCTTLFVMNTCYLDNLCRCRGADRQMMLDKTLEVIGHVQKNMADATAGLSQLALYVSVYQVNLFMLELMHVASSIVDFDYFMHIVLDATIYASKDLFVHTIMVKEICLILLDYVLEHEPQYLDGVAGQDWTYWRDHREEALSLMEKSALCHDIGKYFCLDYVTNSSRNLTNEEFEIIKEHPTNFSAIYRGVLTPEIECIRDCAELHHLWFDASAGYPRKEHTANKPFVNILTIADCIDAATDNIGRPYGLGKTLEQVTAEFDSARGTRYCGRISELLHVEEIRQKINHMINERRKEIYCDIYFREQ